MESEQLRLECQRLTQRLEQVQRQLEDARTALTQQRESSQALTLSAQKHDELMQKVRTLLFLGLPCPLYVSTCTFFVLDH